jgi:Arc/MetJ-type ribon-helix-helix transcriptional regulator
MPFSFRLDYATAAKIRRLAKATGQSRSDVVREAVARWGDDEQKPTGTPQSALDVFRSFAGIISTNGAQLSTNTHATYRDLLKAKHRGRRPH